MHREMTEHQYRLERAGILEKLAWYERNRSPVPAHIGESLRELDGEWLKVKASQLQAPALPVGLVELPSVSDSRKTTPDETTPDNSSD